jgi:hypothetical protein
MSVSKPTGTNLIELNADPAKAFFVQMLTRDLTLEDAILDLLDNCVDGALRAGRAKNGSNRFRGFHADIEFSNARFSIRDNCGGIPENKLKYAFMHGRPPDSSDNNLATVGIYGIGMKRAIYKIGEEAKVSTKSGKLSCEVPFSKAWMSDTSWKLPLHGSSVNFKSDGTLVNVTSLRSEVQKVFSIGLSEFEKKLDRLIGEHYAYILEQGFKVKINGKELSGKPIDLSYQKELDSNSAAFRPYFWESTLEDVHVFLTVGFYAPPPSKGDVDDDENEEENWKSEHSGWTVICNHRVVAYCDKTFLTGWGDKPIPRFHTQFNAIRGLVVFESADASKLPTTTTKHGLDTGKPLYAEVKNVMKDGLRLFIDSTNKWKGETEKSRELLKSPDIEHIGLEELKVKARSLMKANMGGSRGKISKPKLPEPERPERPTWIRFARPKEEVKLVAEYLFSDDEAKPAEVGEACSELALKKAKR